MESFFLEFWKISKVTPKHREQWRIYIHIQFIKTEYAIVNIKRKTIDLLKKHIYSKNEAFRE